MGDTLKILNYVTPQTKINKLILVIKSYRIILKF
jgi:hypothetical protein